MIRIKIRTGPRKGVKRISGAEKERLIRELLEKRKRMSGMDMAKAIGVDSSGIYSILNAMPDVSSEETVVPNGKVHKNKKVKLYFLKDSCPSQT